MPTPSEDTIQPTEIVDATPSSQNGFMSCPPEEQREPRAPRDGPIERVDTPHPASLDDHTTIHDHGSDFAASEPMPGRDATSGTHDVMETEHRPPKGEHIEDAGILVEPPSPTVGSPDVPSDSDTKLAQSMSTAAISPATPPPQYLRFPELDQNRQTSPSSTTSFLRPGSKFRGTQQSDRQVYDVQVEIKDVDLAESFLCGYLRIQGLTDDHPTLTTFFEGEIIGPKYLFKTTHTSWGSSEKVDLQHWARFPAWRPLAKSAKSPNFTLKNYQQREHLFMRWKEYFLVPDHRVKTITGASFEGFYYICFNQASGSVSGIYFHAKSEKYQQLELKHVEDRGCMPAMEFR
ncbi:Glucose-induced degradation protein 4 [Fulvia fulva]|uniref:Glucose-induced degradation protein 4 n=1 Tax=Passalora fulva TaxID=5499 RepID=A0A9Q8L6G2_PASFU|nr:Glucose-induced degradation protein 4 [Fulvia fulva]KAK4638357.1 Glucose-induced degradation protein 4 [Fulvia fulva]UJO11682.1 Glucose-induced degradation protein 4 [Fulvia fulva]